MGTVEECHVIILQAVDKNAERWLLLLFYVMLVLTMFIEVVRREVFSYSSIWGEEIVRYSFIYLAWIGAAAAVKERGHIRIDVLMQYVGPKAKALLYIFGDIVMAVVASLRALLVAGNRARLCEVRLGDPRSAHLAGLVPQLLYPSASR
jgi:TRAP-type C4-dicarboxylate transport system permease small subunit